MDQVFKVKLTGRLREARTASARAPLPAPAAAPAAPVPAPSTPPPIPASVHQDLGELARLAKEIRARQHQSAAEAAQLSVELGVAIAEHLVGDALEADRQRLDRIVLGVLEKMPSAQSVTVRGQANDVALLQKQLAAHTDWATHKQILKFRHDDSSPRGRLKIEADDWFVDWDVQRCLKELKAALLEETYVRQT